MIRIARIFTGTKDRPNYREELQYAVLSNITSGQTVWKPVETVWASAEDEEKYNKAVYTKNILNNHGEITT